MDEEQAEFDEKIGRSKIRNYGSLKDTITEAKDEETSASPEGMLMTVERSAPNYLKYQVPIELFRVDRVFIEQKFNGLGKGHKFLIKRDDGVDILTAVEEGSFIFGNHRRGFTMHVVNNQGVEVLTFQRPWTWTTSELEVYMGGLLVSLVHQKFAWWGTVVFIYDAKGKPIMKVKGAPLAHDFEIQSRDKKVIGGIGKVCGGLFWRLSKFEIAFPADLDVRYKAAIIGTCILLDYMDFEKRH